MEWVYYKPVGMVWITALTKEYSSLILEQLVNKGYSVSALAADGKISAANKNAVSTIISLSISKSNLDMQAKNLSEEVINCLCDIKALYYSVIVMVGTDVAWVPGNIVKLEMEPCSFRESP